MSYRRSVALKTNPSLISTLLLLGSIIETTSAQERGQAQAVRVPQGPKINGKLSDPLWQKAPLLILGEVTSPQSARFKTTARILFDETSFCAGWECEEPDTGSLRKQTTQRDGSVWEDDCVELFVGADPEIGYRHIAINAGGAILDQACSPDGKKDLTWNPDIKAKVWIEEGQGWSVTLSIPLRELGAFVGHGMSWRLNVTRSRPPRGDLPLQEFSWAILPSTQFHQPDAFGLLSDVSIPKRSDGVTRQREQPASSKPPLPMDSGTPAGDITLYYSLDFEQEPGGFEPSEACRLEIAKEGIRGKSLRIGRVAPGGIFGATLPLRIPGSKDLKIAYHCRSSGVPEAGLNAYDQIALDNTTSKAYRWLYEDRWTPILYYIDAFRHNSQPSTSTVGPETFFQAIRFHGEKEGSEQTWMLVDSFVVYRGDDRTPPERVQGLEAEAGKDGIHLRWQAAKDNTAVMLYVIARAEGEEGAFKKIAESFTNHSVDRVAEPGIYRYSVLACDFEENLGDWCQPLRVQADFRSELSEKSIEQKERERYRERVLAIARAGQRNIQRNLVVCYGDSLTGATLYPLMAQAALGIKRIAAYGYEGKTTSFGREHAGEVFERDHPYLALVLFGTNNPKDPESIRGAMEDLVSLVETAAAKGTMVILGTIPPRGFGDPESRPEAEFNRALVETCGKHGIPCGHLFEEYQRHPDRRDLIAGDGVHNTAAGMAASARAWKRVWDEVHFVLRDKPFLPPGPETAPSASVTQPKGEIVRLRSTADVWLSDANPEERISSSGKCSVWKIKSIQEMAAIRFDATPARGRQVLRARLFLRRSSDDLLRYLRVSTVNQDWEEGNSSQAYGPADGATWLFADHATRRSWAWPGSEFCDVIMTSGNSLASWAERKEGQDGWVSVEITPELIYALVAGDTDGLAVMDGGNLAYHNNFIHSVQSPRNEPYLEVELGRTLEERPAAPLVEARPATERAHLNSGAIQITIAPAPQVFCWKIFLDGQAVERWRVKHPAPQGPTTFFLEDLPPSHPFHLDVTAVSPGGLSSQPTRLKVTSSPALSQDLSLKPFQMPSKEPGQAEKGGRMAVWAYPGIVKVSPTKPAVMFGDLEGPYQKENAVWDGKKIRLWGARGEYVSCQLCIENLNDKPLSNIRLSFEPLQGPENSSLGNEAIECFRNWYAQNRDKVWQPAYAIPLPPETPFHIPDPKRNLPGQQNQSLSLDIFIHREARPGLHRGAILIQAEQVDPISLPLEVEVLNFTLPDRLSFWPELNAYNIPAPAHDYYRLAHQHRCILNCWVWKPQVRGSGRDTQVIWDEYDRNVGPLLDGKAFQANRRAGAPVECMYLPFADGWPTSLTPETYRYTGYWPGRGEEIRWITEHYQKAPYIGDGLTPAYKEAFLAVERQFIDHFQEKGWDQTEMQCFFGGKNTHRIEYGVKDMWWTTDEPYHWDDWLALQFFCQLWTHGRAGADATRWVARADISRPNWQGRVLGGIVDTVYFGGFNHPQAYRRGRILSQETGLKIMTYGSASADNTSSTGTVVWMLHAWLKGANGVLPWQTLGGDAALDWQDAGTGGGAALLVPGTRFGFPVVADLRLKAFRDGQQILEYLTLLAERRHLEREQIQAMIFRAMSLDITRREGASVDNADALQFSTLQAWQISELRRSLAALILEK